MFSTGRVIALFVSTGRDTFVLFDSFSRLSDVVVSTGRVSAGLFSVKELLFSLISFGFDTTADSIGLSTGAFTEPFADAKSAGLSIVFENSEAI